MFTCCCQLLSLSGAVLVRAYAGFTNLRELRLDGCEGASTLASLAELRGLTALSLQRCAAICGLRHLAGAPLCRPDMRAQLPVHAFAFDF
jgi:hypothetical protein